MFITAPLAPLRAHAGKRRTQGLDDATLARFADNPDLRAAIDAAAAEYAAIGSEFADLLDLDEDAQMAAVQSGFVNFYAADAVNPYIALAARGPWIVTLKGAVIHDSGGYGMLGFGHAPEVVINAMAKPRVCANIMTPNLAQRRLDQALRKEVGHTRGACPYSAFMCLSGRAHYRHPRQDHDRPRRALSGAHDQTSGGQRQFPRAHRSPGTVFRFQSQGLPAAPGQLS